MDSLRLKKTWDSYTKGLYCCKLNRNIEIAEDEDFPDDCPLEDD